MRIWFSGGPLDGCECDIDKNGDEEPSELLVNLEGPDVAGRTIATYEPIKETDGGWKITRA